MYGGEGLLDDASDEAEMDAWLLSGYVEGYGSLKDLLHFHFNL